VETKRELRGGLCRQAELVFLDRVDALGVVALDRHRSTSSNRKTRFGECGGWPTAERTL
jgi:hypothetical protein